MSKKLLFLISFVLVVALGGNCLAATLTWDNNAGAGNRRWDDAANWAKTGPASAPTATDAVVIDDQYTDASNGPQVLTGMSAVCNTLTMGASASPSVEAVMTMTGGTLTTGGLVSIGGSVTGDYKFDFSNGSLTIGGRLALGYAADANATFNMDGGNLSTTGDLFLGVPSAGTSYPIVNITDGNIVIGEDIELAEYGGASGTINISGGVIEVGDNIYVGWEQTGPAIFNMTGGTVTSGVVTDDWIYVGGGDATNCYVNLDGGTLSAPGISLYPDVTFNVAGGTFIVDGDYINVANGWIWNPVASDWSGTLATPGVVKAYSANEGDIITDGNYPGQVGLRAVLVMDYGVRNPGQTTVTAMAIDANQAWDPNPRDGASGVVPPVTLSWTAGENAASHDVYFGTSFAEVNSADTSSAAYKGNQPLADVNYPVSVVWAKPYYWRIDEVNGASPPWTGNVWNFVVAPAWATEPSPGNGAEDVVPIGVVLSWTPGPEAATHELYFSTDYNDVNDRLITPLTPGANSYSAGNLELDATYYWAVDEVNLSADVNVWPGAVWSFTTDDHLVADNFNSYASNTELYAVWDDYWTNGTGSEIFMETSPDLIYEGNSLKFQYDNANKKQIGSRIDADTIDLEVGSDWTHGGVKGMWLVFAGQPDNSTTAQDRMWVELEDTSSQKGVARYDGDPNNLKKENYQEWNIDLSIFDACGVSLSNVSKVHIGFGGLQGGQDKVAGGTGTVWFDRIEVWPPWCRTELVVSDITGDCVTDNWDLQVLAADWLLYDYNYIAAEPCEANLIGWWKLDEGLGTITVDSSIYGNDGNIIEATWTTGHPNDPCDSALDFDGDGVVTFDHVVCAERVNDLPGIYPAELMPDKFTVACWTKLDSFSYFSSFVGNGMDTGDDECGFFFYNYGWEGDNGQDFGLAIRTEAAMNYVETENIYDTKTWYHLAATYDGNYATIYVDGQLAAGPTDVGGPMRWVSADSNNYPERFTIGVWLDPGYSLYVNGVIDDVRYYNYPLSQGDIAVLGAGIPPGTELYQPVPSLANITDPEAPLSRKVNFNDYGIIADNWLVGPVLWP